jgi:type VI secretion system protein ImpL
VLTLYEDDYIRQWKDLIQDIETVPSMQDTQLLGILAANPGSPLRGLLKAIDENTYLAGPSDKPEPTGAIASAKRMLGNAVKQGQAAVGMPVTVPGTRTTAEFRPIHQLMAGEAGGAPIDRILGDLQAINQALLKVGTGVGQTSRADPNATQQLNALLATLNQDAAMLPPSIAVWFTQVGARTQRTLSSGAAADVMKQYRQDVQDSCLKTIQGRYPFDRGSGTDVPIADFGRVFGSRGVFDSFFQQTLAALVDTAGPSWTWKTGVTGLPVQMLRQFQAAEAIRKMFFPSGTVPRVEFTLTMSEALGGVKKVVLDIDGKLYDYPVGAPKSFQAVWPDVGPPQAQARFEGGPLGVQATSAQNKPWAWFHVLDGAGGPPESTESVALRMAAGAYSVKIRIAAASINNPFTDSRWRDFSCGGF